MTSSFLFAPPRRRGLMFHIALGVGLAALSVLAFAYGISLESGSYFVLLLLLSLLLFAPLPLVIYRAYALARATYRLERDGIRLRWGLRAEDIPLPRIEWVRPAADLTMNLPLPRLSTPGAVLGSVHVPNLGPVEFMASSADDLLLIATDERVYAISPEDSEGFLRAFGQTMELGSLTPLSSVSVLPAAYLSSIWADTTARTILIIGLLLTLLLFGGVGALIPLQTPDSPAAASGSPTQMLLLPILSAFIYVVDFATGLFFYRRDETRLIAYLVWFAGVLSSLLFLIGAAYIML